MKLIGIFLGAFLMLMATQEGRRKYFPAKSYKIFWGFLVNKPDESGIVSEIPVYLT